MKRQFLEILIISLLGLPTAFALSPISVESCDELACKVTADCTVIPTVCNRWIAVSKSKEEKVKNRLRFIKAKCRNDSKVTPKPEVACDGGYCKMINGDTSDWSDCK